MEAMYSSKKIREHFDAFMDASFKGVKLSDDYRESIFMVFSHGFLTGAVDALEHYDQIMGDDAHTAKES